MYFNRIRNQYICNMPEPTAIKNKLSGTINEADTGDRSVWAYDRNTGELLGSTMIDRTTRQWELYLDPARSDESITLICRDESGKYNGDIFDRVSLCRTEFSYPAGLMGMMSYPGATLLSENAAPDYFNKFCTVEVPELKGDIAKIIPNGAQVDKAYPVKFVNSAGTEITNDVTSNNIILNDDSVVLNKITRAPNLVTWKKNIFNDGSEIFHPIWDGKSWSNFYGGQPFEITCNVQPDEVENNCTTGKFEEAALLIEEKQGNVSLTGANCKIDTKNVNALSVSFWYKSNGYISTYPVNITDHSPVLDIVSFTDASKLAERNLFRLGIRLTLYDWNGETMPKRYIFSSSTTTTNNKDMPGNFTFSDWHHFVITQSGTTLKVYIDKTLACTLNQPGLRISDLSCLRFGKGLDTAGQDNRCVAGIYSGVRAFKKVVSDAEITQLYNDTPTTEKLITSVKGMEYDGGMLCLGGVPYSPVVSSDVKKVQYPDGTEYRVLKNWSSAEGSKFVGELASDYIRFKGNNYSSTGYYTALSSRPDSDITKDMGFNLNNIDIYLRVYLEDSGYIFKLGNKNNSLHLYWYANSNGLMYRFRNAAGVDSGDMHIEAGTRPTDVQNKWIRIKWIQDRILVYDDDGTTIICNHTIPNFSVQSETKGQISVGCQRGGSMSDQAVLDSYGGTFRISDLHIYEKGKIDIDQPLLKYEFGWDRGMFGGLYLLTVHNIFTIPPNTVKGDIQELNDNCILGMYNTKLIDWNNSLLYKGRGYTFLTHNLLYKNPYNGSSPYFIYVGDTLYWYNSDRMRRYTCRYYKGKNGLNSNEYTDINVFKPARLNEWNHICFTFNQEENKAILYNQGFPVNGVIDNLLTPNIGNNPLKIDKQASTVLTNLNIYPVVLSSKSIRNAAQNYSGKCYKDEMLVAFMDENTAYPVYMNTPISRIFIQGKDNGQVLTFACTKDNENYYIYTTEWKKILTKEGNFWKYFDGAAWQNGGTVKWKAASLAMDIPTNRMTLQKINSLSAVQINTLHDINVGTFNLAIGMKSDGTISPYVERIVYNDEKVWLSPVIDLADFDQTKYITKMYLSKVLVENKTDGIKFYVHKSGELGWQECQNFTEVPGIIKNSANTGTVQFKVVAGQSKDNKSEPALLEITIQ